MMTDLALRNFLTKHSITEEEFRSYDRTTQAHLTVQAHHGEYCIHDVEDRLHKHEFKEAYKAAFYCAPVETLMTTSTVGFILPFVIVYGLSTHSWTRASGVSFFNGIRSRSFLLTKTRRTKFAVLLGSFVIVNSYLLERMRNQIHKH